MAGLSYATKRFGLNAFGFSNVKTRDELRAVGRSARTKADALKSSEDWGLDANDALFVPILANSKERHISNFKSHVLSDSAFSKAKYESNESNPYGVNASDDSVILVRTRLGIYSSSAAYCEKLELALPKDTFECNYFGLSDSMGPKKLAQALSIDIWIVNLLDEDETPALDEVMNICSEKTCLFLLEKEPTTQCLSKLEEFLHAA